MPTRKGNSISFWKDPWILDMGPLIFEVPTPANINLDCLLSDIIIEEGFWNLDLLRLWLLDDILRHIVSIPPPHSSASSDRISWVHTSNGIFSLEIVY